MLVPDHPDPSIAGVHLLEALGSRDADFLDGLLKQLCNIGSHGRSVDEEGLNFMLSIVKGIEPRDQVEAPFGAPPPAPWKRHTVQPRSAGSDHWFDGGAPPQLPFDLRCEPALLA